MHPSAVADNFWFLENLGRGGDLDGQRQGRVGLRAGAGRQDVPGGRAGQVPVCDALRPALLLGAPELERLARWIGSDPLCCLRLAPSVPTLAIAGRRSTPVQIKMAGLFLAFCKRGEIEV